MPQPERLRVRLTHLWPKPDDVDNLAVPAPFHVELDPRILHVWSGVVAERGHPFDGRAVYLSQRNPAWTGQVTVEISPGDPELQREGYARLSRRPDQPLVRRASAPNTENASTPHGRLLSYWRDVSYRRDVLHGEPQVASLEAHYGLVLPADFRAYLLGACSTLDDGGDMDEHTSWWGLERIRSVQEEGYPRSLGLAADPRKTLRFADYLIYCWSWSICCDAGPNHGRVMVDESRWSPTASPSLSIAT